MTKSRIITTPGNNAEGAAITHRYIYIRLYILIFSLFKGMILTNNYRLSGLKRERLDVPLRNVTTYTALGAQ